jgi:hypothetical protein
VRDEAAGYFFGQLRNQRVVVGCEVGRALLVGDLEDADRVVAELDGYEQNVLDYLVQF